MADNLKEKARILQAIEEEIKRCKICKKKKVGLSVAGEGHPNANIIFLGMAPGAEESRAGKPFVGRSGKFLTRLLSSLGIKREDIFITSPLKYYPGRRAITEREIRHGMIHTSKQIETIDPKLIVMLGNVALKALFPKEKLSTLKIHGKIIKKGGRIYFPTFHPAAAMRFPKIRALTIKDFQKLREIITGMGL